MKVFAVDTARNKDFTLVPNTSPTTILYMRREQAEAFIRDIESDPEYWTEDDVKEFHHVISEIEVGNPYVHRDYAVVAEDVFKYLKAAAGTAYLKDRHVHDGIITGIAKFLGKMYREEIWMEHKEDSYLRPLVEPRFKELEYEIEREITSLKEE